MESIVKICNQCNIEKPITEFHKHKSCKYGVKASCKECANEYNKAYRQENREALAEYSKAYYQENRESVLERRKAYIQENREAILEHKKAYYQENREAIAEKSRIRRQSGDIICYKCGERIAVNGSACAPCRNLFSRKPDGSSSLKMLDYFTCRDGDKCAYCSDELQHGVKGEVHYDHIVPTSWRNGMGSHHVSNMVMCCRRCNSAKYTASLDVFASRAAGAGYWSPAPYVAFLVGKTPDQLRAMGLVREHRDPVNHPFTVVNDGDLNEGLFAELGE